MLDVASHSESYDLYLCEYELTVKAEHLHTPRHVQQPLFVDFISSKIQDWGSDMPCRPVNGKQR